MVLRERGGFQLDHRSCRLSIHLVDRSAPCKAGTEKTESVTLSTFGGFLGTGFGFILALIISKVSPLPAAVQVWSVAMGIGITAVVGLFFGLYPAMRAAKLDPIEALRRE